MRLVRLTAVCAAVGTALIVADTNQTAVPMWPTLAACAAVFAWSAYRPMREGIRLYWLGVGFSELSR